jgi:hypothetical protein
MGQAPKNMVSSLEFWPVGAGSSSYLRFERADISAHLVADWIPSMPATSASAFMGWPDFLIHTVPSNKRLLLALNVRAGRSERQWKGVLSWMLGVAGARHYLLRHERYRWIAPVSAFYRRNTQTVDLGKWPNRIPPSTVKTARRKGSQSNLTPDYLVLRSTVSTRQTGRYEWGVAEAKGTAKSLDALSVCPARWAAQARNIRLTVGGVQQTIQRHIVTATRVSASRPKDRFLQLRAWNSEEKQAGPDLSPILAVEVAAGHLFGLFRGLGLPQNANAIALGISARGRRRRDAGLGDQQHRQAERAATERRSAGRTTELENVRLGWRGRMQTEAGDVDVGLAEPVVRLAQQLSVSGDADEAVEFLRKADADIDEWWAALEDRPQQETRDDTSLLPYGLAMRIPFVLREEE